MHESWRFRPCVARDETHDGNATSGKRNSNQQRLGVARPCQFSGDIENLRSRHENRDGSGDSGYSESVSAD